MLYTWASFEHYSIYKLCTFTLNYMYIQYMHLVSVALLQNDQNGKKFKKAKRNSFCFTECKYDAYLLIQHRQLTNGRNVRVLFFAKVPSIKYVC